jgi:glycolate oxidase iron-sulfur subunit
MFRNEDLAEDAKVVSTLAKDISEVMIDLKLNVATPKDMRVAYHSACSLQHGQQIKNHPKTLLKEAGFTVLEPSDPHLCCGSAGTYNLMQPEISKQLKTRKVNALEAIKPEVIAAGNIGFMMQIGSGTGIPVVHTVELLDWATGGPKPKKLTQI